jgi:peptidyl-prolyl cis-trans isomerase SurA
MYILFVLSIIVSIGVVGPARGNTPVAAPTVLDRIIASVDQEVITESELEKQVQQLTARSEATNTELPELPVLKKQLLERMILEKLQLQLAKKEGISANPETIATAIADIAKRENLSLEELKSTLNEQGITFSDFQNTIKTQLILSQLQQKEIGKQISISSKDLENAKRNNKDADELYQQRFEQALKSWLKRLRANAEVTIYLDDA